MHVSAGFISMEVAMVCLHSGGGPLFLGSRPSTIVNVYKWQLLQPFIAIILLACTVHSAQSFTIVESYRPFALESDASHRFSFLTAQSDCRASGSRWGTCGVVKGTLMV